MSLIYHPMQLSSFALQTKRDVLRHKTVTEHQMSGFFDDLFDSAWDAVSGLAEAMSSALTSVVDSIKQIGETIALVVRAAIGDVEWSEVFSSLGKIFQNVGNIMVVLNPIRVITDILKDAPVTAHAFAELDKFTGGFITNVTNVSDVVYRAMRGDPISKVELMKDILTIVQITAIIFTGPMAAGIMVGGWVGREVCSKQTEHKDLCRLAFQIVGAAAGSWYGAVTGSWGASADAYAQGVEFSAAEEAAWLEGEAAYQAWLESQAEYLALQSTTSFMPHLSSVANEVLLSRGVDVLTREAISLCQSGGWVGHRECEILAQVAANYLTAPEDIEWNQFLAMEVARIGVEALMLQWFPPDSPESRAIRWNIQYRDVIVPVTQEKKASGVGTVLLLAAGGMMMLVGAS